MGAYACYHTFNGDIKPFAALFRMSSTSCTYISVGATDLVKSSFLWVVTVHTEYDTDISCCLRSVCKWCSPYEVQRQRVDVDPSSGVLEYLGAVWGKSTVDACHIKVCILSGDLHIFACTYFMLVKNFSHLNTVVSGYPDQRRPVCKRMKILFAF